MNASCRSIFVNVIVTEKNKDALKDAKRKIIAAKDAQKNFLAWCDVFQCGYFCRWSWQFLSSCPSICSGCWSLTRWLCKWSPRPRSWCWSTLAQGRETSTSPSEFWQLLPFSLHDISIFEQIPGLNQTSAEKWKIQRLIVIFFGYKWRWHTSCELMVDRKYHGNF